MKKLGVFLVTLLIAFTAYAALDWEIPNNVMKMGDGSNATSKSLEMKMGLGASNPIISSTNGTEMNVNIPLRVQGTFTAEGAGSFLGNDNTFGNGLNSNKKNIFDIGAGANNPYFGYDTVTSSLVFSNDGTLVKKIGSGDGGGSGGILSLDNSGFEDGITAEWSCTASRCTEESTSPLVLTKSLKFDPAVQNDFFESTLKAIPVGIMGAACESRVFYTGGDENLSAQVLDGNGLVLSEIVLKSHSIASFESLFYLCPTQSEILGDAQKGNLKLKVLNKTVVAAATSTFDEMYKGSLIGLIETVLPDVASVVFDDQGVVLSSSSDILNGNCTRVAAGNYDCLFKVGLYSEIPSCNATANSTFGSNPHRVDCHAVTTSGFTIHIQDSGASSGVYADNPFNIIVQKQGVDAKQSVQVFKSIPKVSENINQFSAEIESTVGTVSKENTEWLGSTCIKSGAETFTCAVNVGVFSLTPNCTATTLSSSGNVGFSASSSTSSSLVFQTSNNTDSGSAFFDFSIKCEKQGVDFKLPTAQLVLVNQIDTSVEKGQRVESCTFVTDALTIHTPNGCSSWITSFTPSSTAIGFATIKAGIFSATPDCVLSSTNNNICVSQNSALATTVRFDFRSATCTGGAESVGIATIICKGDR